MATPTGFQKIVGQRAETAREDAHEAIPADLQKSGHEDGNVECCGDMLPITGEEPAPGGDCPAPERVLQPPGRLDDQPDMAVEILHEAMDVEIRDHLVLDGQSPGAGIAQITGEPRMDTVEQQDTETTSIIASPLPASPVRAKTRPLSASPAPVIHILVALMT